MIQTVFYDPLLLLITYFLIGLIPQVWVAVLAFSLDQPTAYIIWNLLSTSHLKTVVSLGLNGRSLLLACVYHPPGSCTCKFQEEFMSFVGFLSSINSSYQNFCDFNIHVDVPGGGGYKFTTFLDSCDLKQFVNQLTHLLGHTLDLILSPTDQDTISEVKIGDFVSDHPLVKCSIILPHQAAHTQNKVKYRRYHRINMSDFRSDLKNTSFVKSPTDSVVDLYDQYVHDLADILDKHAPLISRLIKKDSIDWVSDSY